MGMIQFQRLIHSETLQLPELRAFLGKTVAITVTEVDPHSRNCLETGQAAPLDRPALEALKDAVTPEQYQALEAIASAGGPDAEAIRRVRGASMT